ncbi:MAG: isopeptide-forming domain-containing fimbrial protein, partial [Methanothrix sp.]
MTWTDSNNVQHSPSANSVQLNIVEPVLKIAKSANPTGPLVVGSTVPYTLTVQAESGPTYSDAYDLMVTDVLPLHMSYVSSNPSGSYDPATRTITWTIPHLAMGDSLTIAYIAQIDPGVVAGDILINNAGVSWTSTPGTNPNERSYIQTSNSHVNLDTTSSLTKTLNGPASRTIGDMVGYTIQATLPAAIAKNVVITDTLPKGLIYVPDSLTLTPPNPGSQPVQTTVSSPNDGTAPVTITWSFGDVDNSNNANFKIDFNSIVANTPDNKAGIILDANSATMTWTDSNNVQHSPSANSVLLTVVPPKPGIKIVKIAKTTSGSPGAEINFTINITNTGNLMLQSLTVTDELPQGLSYVSDDHGGTVRGQTITWRFDLLEKEQTITINLIATIDVGASGNLINGARVNASDIIIGQTVNDSNSTGITSKVPRIKVEKTVKLPEPLQYEQFCDTRTISGTGKMESTVSVKDTRVALEYASAIAGEGDIEIDSVQAMSEAAGKLQRFVSSLNQTNLSNMNFYEASKVNFRGDTSLIGSKSIRSVSFHGGMGAGIDEAFRVDQMETNQTTYFGSTTNATQAHVVGMDTQSTFNGSMNSRERVHKMFDTKIDSDDTFSGRFDIESEVKFHQNATQVKAEPACEGIDC